MCLVQRSATDLPDVTEAYKCFIKKEKGYLNSSFVYVYQPRRRWLTANPYTGGNLPYKGGFHCFLRKEDAIKERDWNKNYREDYYKEVVHRVLVKNIFLKGVYRGMEEDSQSIVCEQIYIMEEIV